MARRFQQQRTEAALSKHTCLEATLPGPPCLHLCLFSAGSKRQYQAAGFIRSVFYEFAQRPPSQARSIPSNQPFPNSTISATIGHAPAPLSQTRVGRTDDQ